MKEGKLAVITARGGSKRIPKKNIKEFCGRPIIAYSIEAALKSDIFTEVMVSTDSEEIAEIALQYGAKVPFMRSKKTSDDYATTSDVLMEVLECYRAQGKEFVYLCCIYPTAPFVTADKLRDAMQIMEERHSVMVMPMVAFSYPPQRCFVREKDGSMRYKYKEYIQTRSQDLEKLYHDAGQFYFYDVKQYISLGGNIEDNITPIFVAESEVQDIDTIGDWNIAELKYQMLK